MHVFPYCHHLRLHLLNAHQLFLEREKNIKGEGLGEGNFFEYSKIIITADLLKLSKFLLIHK